MPSPFPGMDPWLEATDLFPDVHASLTIRLQEVINASLPDGYFAATKTITWVDTTPSLHSLDLKPRPLTLKQYYLKIRMAADKRVVTAVMLVNRANKAAGDSREAYIKKQDELIQAGANIVEVDLLRFGTSVTQDSHLSSELPPVRANHYHVCTSLAHRPEQLFRTVFPLRRPLPAIDIPLDPGVSPVRVELQPLLDRAYDAGRFFMRAGYDRPAEPLLAPDDQAWADGVLQARRESPGGT